MSEIIKKNQCLKKELEPNIPNIHPLINYLMEYPNLKEKQHFVLPQVENNIIIYNKNLKTCVDNKINSDSSSDSELFFSDDNINKNKSPSTDIFKTVTSSNKSNDYISFSFPINSNNFLDVIFNITNINQLINWLTTYDINDKNTIDLVLNMFWTNHYATVNDNINEFNELNFLIVKLLFNKVLTNDKVQQLSNKIISKNYGKNIVYLEKIKKYINE